MLQVLLTLSWETPCGMDERAMVRHRRKGKVRGECEALKCRLKHRGIKYQSMKSHTPNQHISNTLSEKSHPL